MDLWDAGDIKSRLQEGRALQSRLENAPQVKQINSSRKFANLMFEGEVKAALRLLPSCPQGGFLKSNDLAGNNNETVIDILRLKHPPDQPLNPSAVTNIVNDNFRPVIFEEITPSLIPSISLQVQGSAGPSGLDAAFWRRMCTCFHSYSDDLCKAISKLAIYLSTVPVDPEGLSAFAASRLIALDKHPGVRPIGVGEVLRQIVCKAILSICHRDIQSCVGTLQLCVGHKSGCEAAVHALCNIFSNENTNAVILVDASNAFNSLNRKNAMVNIQRLCPSLATITANVYRHAPELFIDDQTLLSREGTTQGDPLAMAIYAISIMPLVHSLNSVDTKQIWFADDSSAGGTLDNLHEWWTRLQREGPTYGYHPNSTKSCIIVKENKLAEAHEKFSSTGLSICAEGHEYLGSAIGKPSFIEQFIKSKVQSWSEDVIHLAGIASSQPHAAYSAYTHGLASKWNYILRTPHVTVLCLLPLRKQ